MADFAVAPRGAHVGEETRKCMKPFAPTGPACVHASEANSEGIVTPANEAVGPHRGAR